LTAFIISRDTRRLLIASNTLAYSPDLTEPRPLGFAAKAIPIPHLRAALCSRGALQIGTSAAAHLALTPGVATYQDAIEALPEILTGLTTEYAEKQDIEAPEDLMLYEALFCGWNEATGRGEVTAFRNFERFEPIPDDGRRGLSAIPDLPAAYVPKALAGAPIERQLVGLMQAMRRYFAEHPEVNPALIGGEIVLTEITAQAVQSRIVHKFEDYEQCRHAAAAVWGRIGRGDLTVDVEAGVCRVDEAIEPPETAVPGASRAERRRAEKLAKKAGRRAA
jgi:hypothetical protein